MSNPSRRDFLGQSLCAAGCLCAGMGNKLAYGADDDTGENNRRRFRYLGWMVGLSYQTPRPEGKRPEELRRLIREMQDHGMNFISFMLVGYSFYDPNHDGFCWPVRRKGLFSYRDERSLNARDETEFLGDIIQEASEAGLHVQLMTNCGIWNPQRIVKGYPKTRPQLNWSGNRPGWVHCPDNPDTDRCVRDVMLDALDRYAGRGVASYAIEWPGYHGNACFCEFTRTAFVRETGRELTTEWARANRKEFNRWKEEHMGGIIKQLVDAVHARRPAVEIWHHTACAPGRGHAPEQLRRAGIAATIPYMMHKRTDDLSDVSRNLRAVHPLPAIGHVCVRSRPFKNYNIPPKDPRMIRKFFDVIRRTKADNLAGLMFFNESNVTVENRKAVYEGIERLYGERPEV